MPDESPRAHPGVTTWRATLALACVPACWSGSPAAAVESRPQPVAIHTCAIEPPIRTPQQLQLTQWLGRIGDRSWILAKHGQQLQLVGLDDRIDIPIESLRAEYVAGTHLWLAGPQHAGFALVDVDLDGPRAAEPLELADIAPLTTIDALAISPERMLLAERGSKVSLQLFDRAHHKLGPVTQINTDERLVPDLRCTGDRCFAVGIEGEAPMRRLYVERFAPGAVEHDVLTEDHVANHQVVQSGDRTVVIWTTLDMRGLFMRVLDSAGRPLTRRARIAGLSVIPMGFEVLPAAPPRIAIRDRNGTWSVGTLDVGGNRLDEVRALPLPKRTWFAGAVMPEGVLGVGFSSDITFEAWGHNWTSSATAIFVPSTRDAEPPIEVLPHATGVGRGGMAAFPLIAPGRAGVLVLPQAFEMTEGGELLELRRPCK